MIDEFVHYIQKVKRYSAHTVTSYKNDVSQFLDFLYSELHWTEEDTITHQQVRSWLVHLMGEDLTAKSINRKISSLRTYFNYLKRMDRIRINQMTRIMAQKSPKRLPSYLQESELENMLNEAQFSKDFCGYRDNIVLELLYQTGIRRAELINLKIRDIDFNSMTIKVFGKGGKERIIPFGKDMKTKISAYLNIRNATFEQSDNNLCLTDKGRMMYPKFVYNIVHNYISKVSTIDMKSPHVLRHSFATHLSNKGAELNAIKELLGHSNLAATQIYTHNTIEKLKEEYHRAHPKGNG